METASFIGLLLTFLLAVYYLLWSRSRFVRLTNALPGPNALPLLGNILELNVNHDGLINVFRTLTALYIALIRLRSCFI